MKRILLFITIVVYGFSALHAQVTCTEQLTNAQRNFDDGLLDDIPALLADCMIDGFTKEEKTNAYKLLMQTYLFTEQIELADELMIQFLTEFPSYTIAVNDPREFIDLYNTYRTKPIYNLEFMASGNISIPIVLFNNSPTDYNSDLNEYSPGIGVNLEANYINTLVGNFDFSAGLSFSYNRLGYYNKPSDYGEVEVTFSSMTVGLPLAVRYDYSFNNVNLFAKAGIETTYLLSYKGDYTTRDRGAEPYTGAPNFANNHNRIDVKPFLGIGAKINLGRDQLHIAVGYKFGIINESPTENVFADFQSIVKFKDIEDEKLSNSAGISISYFRPIFKPKKLN